jgi:hypothetical protein
MEKNTYIASNQEKNFFNDAITYIASNTDGNYEYKTVNISIPLNIFSNGLSGLEALSKYLKEVYDLRYCDIARLLNRDDRTIWDAYANARQKSSEDFSTIKSEICIPITIFNNRSLSILESSTKYLKEVLNLRYCKIACFLNKDPRTIWTVYNRSVKKRENEKQIVCN